MKKHKLEMPYLVKRFDQHEQLKDSILSMLEIAQFISPEDSRSEVNITKTDWPLSRAPRDWVTYISEPLTKNLLEMYAELGFDGFMMTDIWFQQYLKGSEHGWHVHNGNYTNVYYLELPKGTPPTQLLSPWDNKTVIEVEVEEGDLLICPASVLHKAPKNQSDTLRKTIISYNTEVTYSDEMYKKSFL